MNSMQEHTVKAFDEDITRLRGLIAEMGGLAEAAVERSLEALVKGDDELADLVIKGDKKIDALETEIDKLAVRIIALRAPMADDLREVIAALKIAGVVERVAAEMVHDVLTAYAARDAELAREVIATDEKVDAFYNSIFRNLVSHMVENPSTISSAAQMLFIARNLERVGDHATNVAEMVHFAATGNYPPDEDS